MAEYPTRRGMGAAHFHGEPTPFDEAIRRDLGRREQWAAQYGAEAIAKGPTRPPRRKRPETPEFIGPPNPFHLRKAWRPPMKG